MAACLLSIICLTVPLITATDRQNSPPTAPHATGAEQSGIPIPANAWTTFRTYGFPAEIVGYDATVYAAAIGRHVVLGKYHHYSSEPNYCMDGWSWDENRWDILDCGAYFHTEHFMEGGHPVGAFVYMPSRTSILYWGGQSGSNQPEQAFHTWWWDVAGRTGRDKISTSRPGNIKVSAMAYDESRDKAVFYPDAKFELEIYDPVSNTWNTPGTSGTAPPRGMNFPTLEWDSKDQKIYLYGGAVGSSCTSGLTFNTSVYTFDVATRHWSKLNIAPDPVVGTPAGRRYAGFAYDPLNDIFLLVGGQSCAGGKGSEAVGQTDTWKFDPVAMRWTRLSPTVNYVLRHPADAPFQKLRYDPDHHAFVMILPSYDNQASAGGTWGNYPARVWVYCYSGNCPSVGTKVHEYPAPQGSLNRNGGRPITPRVQTWASDTALAVHEHTLYAGWIESGLPFSNSCYFHHPFVQAWTEKKWALLGSDCTALDSRASSVERDAEKLSLAVVNGAPWASWSESNLYIPAVFAKSWNGTAWTGNPIGTRNQKGVQGFSELISVNGIPTIAFIENNRGIFPDVTEAYVDQYDQGAWQPLGGKLNKSNSGRIESLSIASDGTYPWVCWTEETISGWASVKPAQLHCSRWDGRTWKDAGSSLNRTEGQWAADVSIAWSNQRLYVAWTERSTSGNAQLFVRAFDGARWSLVGDSPLNKDVKHGWVFRPRLATDGGNLFLSWEEQVNLGQPSRLFVARWDGQKWLPLGGAINMEPVNGSAAHSSIAVLDHQPVVLWNEVQIGQLQQTYAKRWDGSNWLIIPPVTDRN